ncbi:hypothetical protein JCM10207_007836 [Rhodosporidiobolus poonsookiae]
MAALHPSSKPALHLSLATSNPSSPAPSSPSSSAASNSNQAARRVASWGSASSDTYRSLQAFGEQSMTALPSPLEFDRDRERREFGFLPSRSSTDDWQGSWGRSALRGSARGRADSVFEEIRDGSIGASGPGAGQGWMDYGSLGTSSVASYGTATGHGMGSGARTDRTNTPVRRYASGDSSEDGREGRGEPTRSKTLSFFDSSGGALSPPPNPPSRNNSLRGYRDRSFGQGHGKDASTGSAASWASSGGGVGSWGAFPSTSPTPPPPPQQLDPLRCSVASSSGGSWLDDAVSGGVERRGRGTSIGSDGAGGGGWLSLGASLNGTPVRRESPARGAGPFTSEPGQLDSTSSLSAQADLSPVSALRPRLAALNTSVSPPSHGGKAESALSTSSFSSPPAFPLSSLPSAIDPPLHPSASAVVSSTTSPTAPRSRFLNLDLDSSPSPASRPFPSQPQPPVQLSSGVTTPASLPSTPQRPARTPHSSDTPTSAPSRSRSPRKPRAPPAAAEEDDDADLPVPQRGDRLGEYAVERLLGRGAFSRVALARRRAERSERRGAGGGEGQEGELVALKLVARKTCEGNERMRISVLREVEVLKNIHHPSLVSLSTTFSTPLYTVLVLDFCPGGELFDFLAEWHAEITEALARRMFGELCAAVGWMHEIGLVHRDIKLENILLTARPFPSTASNILSTLPTPFVKLTDFGLSRFINPSSPLLSTRCGSEAYAAPELIMGKKYDGRLTDAWALGVVLFALITGVMPFVEEPGAGARGRRAYLLRIAKADYRWPGQTHGSRLSTASSSSTSTTPPSSASPTKLAFPSSARDPSLAAVSGPASSVAAPPSSRLVTPSVQALVARLLVRDPAKRARLAGPGGEGDEVWESEWMRGEGRPERVRGVMRRREAERPGVKRGEGSGPDLDEGWARRGSELLDDGGGESGYE